MLPLDTPLRARKSHGIGYPGWRAIWGLCRRGSTEAADAAGRLLRRPRRGVSLMGAGRVDRKAL